MASENTVDSKRPSETRSSSDEPRRSLSPQDKLSELAEVCSSESKPGDRSKLISDALQQEDEFMKYLMSLPGVATAKPKQTPENASPQADDGQAATAAPLARSQSAVVATPKVGLDHLDNLCKLMEQLGDLKEQNSKLQRRVQYLEDLKTLHEMHKKLQLETKQAGEQNDVLKLSQYKRHSSGTASDKRDSSEDGGGKRVEADDPLSQEKGRAGSVRRMAKPKAPSKTKENLLRTQQRERSRSVGIDEIKGAEVLHGDAAAPRRNDSKHRQRLSLAGVGPPGKGKVSKWTRVKEAFRWEKASPGTLPEAKSQDSGLGGEDHRFLKVPADVTSVSPADSVSSAYSSGHSALPRVPLSSSSSSSDDLDLDLNFTDVLSELGPQRSASATDSRAVGRLAAAGRRLSLADEEEAAGAEGHKEGVVKSSSKWSKTPWGKVKDIIQTRKDSLRKRRDDDSDAPDHEPLSDTSLPRPPRLKTDAEGRRAAPTLTLTMPSSDDLRSAAPRRPPPSPQPLHKASTASAPDDDALRRQGSPTRHPSKWTKVKKAFLTSAPGSVPSSPKRTSAFIYTVEPEEELSAVVQRNYEELQQKLSQEFHKKLSEWERLKNTPEDRKKPPRDKRRLHEWQLFKTKPDSHAGGEEHEWERERLRTSSTSSAAESPGHLAKEFPVESQSPGSARKATKNKDLQWLDKELHKIEREKQRLERERDKYLEREARLEKMRRAMSGAPRQQEVLIQTSTGFFRFQGISEKFTRLLYEWEKARGIGPEASTFALLDPQYKPLGPIREGGDVLALTRSKSARSISNLSHHPSTMSLNGVQGMESGPLEESRAVSEPHLRCTAHEEQEPAAVIVDVEDVVVETAAPLARCPTVPSHTPVYCYTPTHNSSVQRNDSVRTQSSYKLLEENMDLLSELQLSEDICRKLENEIEDLECKMEDISKSQEEEIDSIEETSNLERARELDRLKREGASLQDSFEQHAQQQAALAQHLVGNMRQLTDDPLAHVLGLSADLLKLAERLESAVASRSRSRTKDRGSRLRAAHHWLSADGIGSSVSAGSLTNVDPDISPTGLPRQSSEELSELPSLLTSKVLELKKGLSYLTSPADVGVEDSRKEDESETSATFVLRAPPQTRRATLPNTSSADNTSPVSVTIVPSFWRRKSEPETVATYDNNPLGDNRTSPSSDLNRDSFCSAVSSASPTSSVCGDVDEDLELGENGFVKLEEKRNDDPDQETKKSSTPSWASVVSDRHSKRSAASFDTSDESADEVNVVVRTRRRRELSHKGSVEEESSPKTTKLCDSPKNDYGIDVPAKQGKTSRPRKLLRTRRVSDTYVGYTSDRRPSVEGGPESADESGNGEDTSPKNCVAASESVTNRTHGEISRDNVNSATANNGHPDIAEEKETTETVEEQQVETIQTLEKVGILPNVFVKTTRKIFSPVRCDSKGKTSSVISVVVGDNSKGCSSESKNSNVNENHAVNPTGQDSDSSNNKTLENGKNEDLQNSQPVSIGSGLTSAPAWMVRKTRAQSSSPAMLRRAGFDCNESARGCISINDVSSRGAAIHDNIGKTNHAKEMISKACSDNEKVNAVTASHSISCPTTPIGMPPLPQSPGPARRELMRGISKETAPSIRMMIAKYNQKLTEQETNGGRSPEINKTGTASPVAWRSPVAERRVRLQMEKYQEEVNKALQQTSNKMSPLFARAGSEVKKSASAGVIPFKQIQNMKPSSCNHISNTQFSKENGERRGILKSSSAGTIKTPNPTKPEELEQKEPSVPVSLAGCALLQDQKSPTLGPSRQGTNTPSPLPPSSPPISYPSSPEAIRAPKSPPSIRLRALKLKKAKEEFLTRGPGGQSWTSDDGVTSASSITPEPGQFDGIDDAKRSRLSQISVGSESSFDGSVILAALCKNGDGQLLKSASSGMINVDESTYNQVAGCGGSLPRSSGNDGSTGTLTAKSNKFGISSITSRFRKVKMRKAKDKDGSKMNAVSALCRQSLLVDINVGSPRPSTSSGVTAPTTPTCECLPTPSSSKSCPSSPVLPRTKSTDDGPSRWIKNTRKIFKPK